MSLLTLYRPNFCASCGNKIIRLRWRVWTSRKFCQKCAPQFRKEQWLQPILGGVVLLLLSIIFGRAMRPSVPPLVIQRRFRQVASANGPTQEPQTSDDLSLRARTKKGTPCSRRVHGRFVAGNIGLPSMIRSFQSSDDERVRMCVVHR